MKKYLMTKLVTLILVCSQICIGAVPQPHDFKGGIDYLYTPKEGSLEELYKDIIVTELEPAISDEIEKQYGRRLQFDLFDTEFLKIDRENYRGFSFLIEVQVKPFLGAHNIIGIDNMIISVSPYGTKVESFEHIKSFLPPPWLQEQYNELKLKITY